MEEGHFPPLSSLFYLLLSHPSLSSSVFVSDSSDVHWNKFVFVLGTVRRTIASPLCSCSPGRPAGPTSDQPTRPSRTNGLSS